MNKEHKAKEFFDKTSLYLGSDYGIIIRKETINSSLNTDQFETALDIGCGDGSISISLLDNIRALTLLDISSNMLDIAKDSLTPEQKTKVTFINDSIDSNCIEDTQFELTISLGLLSHVNDPEKTFHRIASLLAKNGILVIQNTDSGHWYYKLIRAYLRLSRFLRKDKYQYSFNQTTEFQLLTWFKKANLEVLSSFHYNQSFIGIGSLLSNGLKYSIIRNIFGSIDSPRNQRLGSDGIYFLKRKE